MGQASDSASQRTVYGGPTKRFFVSMLTRDIELDDAILDLLDNCVDGAMRISPGKVASPSPFEGFEARLTIGRDYFEIADNCGGIPPNHLEDAFSLGRPSLEKDKGLPTIGMYGIGMKRAIFKIAKSARVTSLHSKSKVSLRYTEEWLEPDNESWDLPVDDVPTVKGATHGVTISSKHLKEDVAAQFGSAIFCNRLHSKISEHFGYIIQKGFEIWLNEVEVKPSTLSILAVPHSKNGIQPFDYTAKIDEVHVKITIGLFRPLVLEREVDEETLTATSAESAGISVVCNDRVVLLHDRSLKTGWGDGGVPRFHPQFRSIAGLIVLASNNPAKLPISTTKRDLDVGSDVYLLTRQACIEGLKVFTDFTNKWKGAEAEAAEFFENATKVDARREVRLAVESGVAVRAVAEGRKFKPTLPVPQSRTPRRRISFLKEQAEVEAVSAHLFGEKNVAPSIVGETSFDRMLREATK